MILTSCLGEHRLFSREIGIVIRNISILTPLSLAGLLLFSAPVFCADNATITQDGTRIRGVPSLLGEVISHADRGARVEAVARTDFVDTIDGYTAPWYKIYDRRLRYVPFYVFGKYIVPDADLRIPTVFRGSGDHDLMTAFILEGLYAFGRDKSAVTESLGRPLSETREEHPGSGDKEEFAVYTQVYRGVVITGCESDGREWITEVSYSTGDYDFDGVKVGTGVADVERILGAAERDPHDPARLYYYGRTFYRLDLKAKGDRIEKIIFSHHAGN